MPDVERLTRHVGSSTLRVEDAALLTGRSRWVDNVHVEGELHLAVVRSPVAHARIVNIDVSEALARPDVIAAFTGDDLRAAWVEAPPVAAPPGANYKAVATPLAVDVVRYVGEPLAVLLVVNRYAVEDALEHVDVDFEPLPAVVGVDHALEATNLVHSDAGSNLAFVVTSDGTGDVDAAFRDAAVVVRRRLVQQRLMATALEPRSVLAVPDDDGGVTLRSSTQVPHRVRDTVAKVLGLEPEKVRILASHVGGGFGPKLDVYAEDHICAALALELGRPVRYTATRSEDFQSTTHGRAQVQDIEASATADGTLLGLRLRVTGDLGAYLSRNGALLPVNGAKVLPGAYRWSAYSFEARGVYTNTVPVGAYRGAGRPEATFGVERIIDELAAELGMDPAELRRRNFPKPDEFPFVSVGGFTYDSGDYEGAMELALTKVGYEKLRAEQQLRRDSGATELLGIGLASYVDRCGVGPGMPEFGGARLESGGKLVIRTGLGPTGQGTATSLAQIAADVFGIEPGDVTVIHGDTALVPSGTGTFGSRSMSVGGVAVHRAAVELERRAREVAGRLMEVASSDLELLAGEYRIRGAEARSVRLSEVLAEAASNGIPLDVEELFEPEGLTFPFGTYVAVVEVDTTTGAVAIAHMVAVDDAGTIINPALFAGQVHGGLAQGIAQALYEDATYDAEGNLTAGTLIDYLVPTAPDLPSYDLAQTVTPGLNALGVKGIGESGTIGGPPAVVNAVVDALRHLGVKDIAMPCTPARVWRAIEDAGARSI